MSDIRHIARLANVSPATVSRVLNDHPYVSEATRARVLAVVAKENYHRNALASSLRRQVSDVIGYLQFGSPRLEDSRMAQSAETLLFEAGFKTFLCNADGDERREAFYLEEMISRHVAGMILCPQGHQARALAAARSLERAGIACLILAGNEDPEAVSSVAPDWQQALRLAFEHLGDLGHKKVLVLMSGGETVSDGFHLLKGMFASIETRLLLVPQVEGGQGADLASLKQVLTRDVLHDEQATALLCSSEALCLSVLRHLGELMVSVPDDLSLLSFGGADFSRMVVPPLTVVQSPVEDLGSLAAEQLLARIGKKERPVVHIRLETKLFVGASTGSAGK